MVRYLSEEWRAEVEKRFREGITPTDMDNLSSSLNCVSNKCPDDKTHYFFVSFIRGELESVQVGEGEGPQAEYIIEGKYEALVQIARGELTAAEALIGGKIKLTGNLYKALYLVPIVDRLNQIMASIETEYQG